MNQAQVFDHTAIDPLTEQLMASEQWMAAVEATVLAVAMLRQKVESGARAPELESAAYAEFHRALEALKDPASDDQD